MGKDCLQYTLAMLAPRPDRYRRLRASAGELPRLPLLLCAALRQVLPRHRPPPAGAPSTRAEEVADDLPILDRGLEELVQRVVDCLVAVADRRVPTVHRRARLDSVIGHQAATWAGRRSSSSWERSSWNVVPR